MLIEKMFTHPSNKVMTLRSGDKPVTADAIMKAVEMWLRYDPEKPHIFHFAGHGGQRYSRSEGTTRDLAPYLINEVVSPYKREGIFDENAVFISDATFAKMFDGFKSPLLFLMDNCHSDKFVEVCDRNAVIVASSAYDYATSTEVFGQNVFGKNQILGQLTFSFYNAVRNKPSPVDLLQCLRENHTRIGVVRVSASVEAFKVNMKTSDTDEKVTIMRSDIPVTRDFLEPEKKVAVFCARPNPEEPVKKTSTGCWA